MPPWMTSLLREEMPVPMALAALRHHHLVALARGRARHRQPDHAGTDHQDLHRAYCLDRVGKKRFLQLPLNHHLHKNRP